MASLASADTATAGRWPLLANPLNIGTAQSLPWDGEDSLAGSADYDRARVLADTQALLAGDAPVIVRMETLRRAAVYAMNDENSARALLRSLIDRAVASKRSGATNVFALFDAGYAAALFLETERITGAHLVDSLDGYAMITSCIQMRPDDVQLQFAAARILYSTAGGAARAAGHEARVYAAGASDRLVALNLRLITPR